MALAAAITLAGCNTGASPTSTGTGSSAAPAVALTNVTVDLASARTAMISRSGGILAVSGPDGTTYRLDIPSGALAADTQVALYPVTKVATLPRGTLAAAVHFTPEGLTLAYPATLTIGLASGASAEKLLGFSYTGDGAKPVPRPVVVDGRTATLQVTHFSGAGAGTFAERFGSLSGADTWSQTLYDELLNPNHTADSIGQILIDWYHEVVEPKLAACTNIEAANFTAGGPCDLDGNAATVAEYAYDDWLFALRWAKALDPVNVGSVLTLSKSQATVHLKDYYAELNTRCRERASGPVDDSPASPLVWAGLALDRALYWATSWDLATRANELDLETLLNKLCVKVVIDPSRSYSGSHPGESGTLHVPTGLTIEGVSGTAGPLRHDVPIQVKASWAAASAIGNAAADGTYQTTFAWPAGVDPLLIDVYASISSPNPNVAEIAVFDRITRHAGSSGSSAPATGAPNPTTFRLLAGQTNSVNTCWLTQILVDRPLPGPMTWTVTGPYRALEPEPKTTSESFAAHYLYIRTGMVAGTLVVTATAPDGSSATVTVTVVQNGATC